MGNLLNFSDWKMKDSDGKRAVLEHKDGHTMSIAVGALPKIQREQIKRLKMAAGGRVKHYEEGTPDAPVAAAPEKTDAPAAPGGTHISIYAAPAAAPQSSPQPVDGPAQRVPAAAPPMAPPSTQVAPAPIVGAPAPLLPDQTVNAPAAVQLQQKAAGEQGAVEAAKAEGTAGAEAQRVQAESDYANNMKQAIADLRGHTDAFAQYQQANPINPKAYQENMSTGQKISTAIGLLAGGFKAGYRGGENPALDFLNKQIDRNIAAQKERADQQKTVWGAYKQLYGDDVIANNLAKVSANDMLTHQMALTGARLGTAQSKAATEAFRAQKAIENNQLLIESAGRLGTLRTGAGQTAPATPPSNILSRAGGGAPTNPDPALIGGSSELLHPGADRAIDGMGYIKTGPIAQMYPDLQRQYNGVRQAEKGLKTVDNVFPQLANETSFGEWIGKHLPNLDVAKTSGVVAAGKYLLGGGSGAAAAAPAAAGAAGAAALPLLGGIAAAGTAGALAAPRIYSQLDKTRQYESDQTLLTGALSGALKGTNVGGEQIQGIVEKNTPEWGDSKKTLEKKATNIKEFIKAHVDTSLLRLRGLTTD